MLMVVLLKFTGDHLQHIFHFDKKIPLPVFIQAGVVWRLFNSNMFLRFGFCHFLFGK